MSKVRLLKKGGVGQLSLTAGWLQYCEWGRGAVLAQGPGPPFDDPGTPSPITRGKGTIEFLQNTHEETSHMISK